jgi:ABC-2 type transport system permease protein
MSDALRGGSAMRLKGLVRKEFLQIARDPSSIAIAFLMPLFLLVLFGFGVSLDADHLPIALVAEQPTADTADFLASLEGSHYFAARHTMTMMEAEQELREGRVNAIVHLRADFAAQLRHPDGAAIQLIVNGVDANTARLTEGYVEGAWVNWLARRAASLGQAMATPVQLEQRVWYNSEVKSRNFLVPGLVAIIMTLIGTLLTALVMAREWERGTLEALLVTQVTMTEVLLGKIIAYFTLGTGGMLMSAHFFPPSCCPDSSLTSIACRPWCKSSPI